MALTCKNTARKKQNKHKNNIKHKVLILKKEVIEIITQLCIQIHTQSCIHDYKHMETEDRRGL